MKRKVTVIVVMLCAIVFIPVAAIGQSRSSLNLKEKSFDLEIRSSDFHGALGLLAKKYKFPIGLHATENSEPPICAEPFDVSFKSETIDQIMDNLVSKCPVYVWSWEDEVINVEPARTEPFLTEVKISLLEIRQLNTSEIVDAIFHTIEMRQNLLADGLKREDSRPIGNVGSPQKYDLRFENYSVKQILNSVIRTTQNRMWVFQRLRSDNKLVSLDVF